MSFYWDWFQLQWSEWVVNYDFLRQDSLAQALRSTSRDWATRLRDDLDHVRDAGATRLRRFQDSLALAPLRLLLALPVILAVVIFAQSSALREWALLVWRLRVRSGSAPIHAASLSYRRMLHLLERRGWTKLPQQTPLEFAAGLPSGALTAPVSQLTAAYQAARFGGHAPDNSKLASLLADVSAALRGSAAEK
jgi:hypothetical protein